jgi:hypothetical protein
MKDTSTSSTIVIAMTAVKCCTSQVLPGDNLLPHLRYDLGDMAAMLVNYNINSRPVITDRMT